MAISKIIYKTSPQDTGTVWMDATPATATASDITAPKTAMLADGVLTTGTGGGGGTETTIVPEQSVTVTGGAGSNVLLGDITVPNVGDECTVYIDGTPYTVTAWEPEEGVIYLGEADLIIEEPDYTNYPFFIYFAEGDTEFFHEDAGTYTVKVTKMGGGGGGGITLLATDEVTVSTTSTSSTNIKSLNLLGITATDKLFLVFIYDKAGPRNGYFYSSAVVFANMFAKNGISGATSSVGKIIYSLNSGGTWTTTANNYGVFANEYSGGGVLSINARYGSSYGTIDGTYAIEVYSIDIDPFS